MTAETVSHLIDHIEANQSNSAVPSIRRRAAIRNFFKRLVRGDPAHSQRYMRALAIPAKKARQRPEPARVETIELVSHRLE